MAASPDAEPGDAQPVMPAGDGSGCRSAPRGNTSCCDWLSVRGTGSLVCESPGDAEGHGLVSPGARKGEEVGKIGTGCRGVGYSSCKADLVAIVKACSLLSSAVQGGIR